MMRGYNRRQRSTLSLGIWAGGFVFLCALLAWKFQWLPGSNTPESPVEAPTTDITADTGNPTSPAQTVPKPHPLPLDQREPGDGLGGDFNMPERFLAPPDPAAKSGGVRQIGFANTATGSAKKNHPLDGPYDNQGLSGARTSSNSLRLAGYEIDDASPPAQTLAKIDRLIQNGDYLAAHKELSEIYWKHPKWRSAIRLRIEMTAKTIYFDRQQHFITPYVVQPNDVLERIARPYKVSPQYLARLNGITPRNIRPGDRLKMIKGPFSVVVDLSDRELTVHHHGYFVCRYPVGIGREKRSPIGRFKVDNKIENPPYDGRDENGRNIHIGPDDPRNPLGEHWISIGNSYGIHGTIDPKSIGKAESQGCVRMHNKDVAVVYDFLTVGSEVVIQE